MILGGVPVRLERTRTHIILRWKDRNQMKGVREQGEKVDERSKMSRVRTGRRGGYGTYLMEHKTLPMQLHTDPFRLAVHYRVTNLQSQTIRHYYHHYRLRERDREETNSPQSSSYTSNNSYPSSPSQPYSYENYAIPQTEQPLLVT